MSQTANLALPLLDPGQNQKEVTVNEALTALDTILGAIKTANNGKLLGVSSGVASAITVGSLFSISGGTLAMANQSANSVLAGPTSGGSAAPGFRALVAADLPLASVDREHLTADLSGEIQDDSNGLDYLLGTVRTTNTGPVVVRKVGTEWHIYMRAGGRAFQRFVLVYSSSGRDYRFRHGRVERHYKWHPFTNGAAVFTGAAPTRFGTTTFAPTYQILIDNSQSVQLTITGGGQLVCLALGRTNSVALDVVITSTKGLYRASEVASSLTTVSAGGNAHKWLVIAEDLPFDTYTIKLTPASFQGAYPIALGFECDETGQKVTPFAPNCDRVQVGPLYSFMSYGGGASWESLHGSADASQTVNQATARSMTGGSDYLYFGVASGGKFDRVDLTFTNLNTGGAGGAAAVEYFNGTAWVGLTVSNNTTFASTLPFYQDGYIQWAIPSDWADTTVNGVTGRWVRFGGAGTTGSVKVATALVRTVWSAPLVEFEPCTLDTEGDPVFCRKENAASNYDTGGGHGNVSRQSFAARVDNVDITSLADGDAVSGHTAAFLQNVNTLDDEAGSVVGSYMLGHLFGGGGMLIRWMFTPAAVTTWEPWAYMLMLGTDTSAFDKYRAFYPGRYVEGNLPTGGAQTGLGECLGLQFMSNTNRYGLLATQSQPQRVNRGWRHGPKAFLLSGSNCKLYFGTSDLSSGSAGPVVLQSGETVAVENFITFTVI